MPLKEVGGLLTDIGTEELTHMEIITDLTENLAAKQKARTVYDNLLRMIPDPEIQEPLKFLRARETVHFQRFGEALGKTKDKLDSRNFYYFNPEFDKDMFQGKL